LFHGQTAANATGRSNVKSDRPLYLTLGILWGVFFVGFSVRMAVIITMPLIRDDLQISFSQVGFLLSITSMAYGLIQFPAGILTDRFNERTLLMFVTLTLAVALLGISASTDLLFVALSLLFMGLTVGFSSPVSFSILSKRVKRRIGTVFGIYNTAPSFAQFFGTNISSIIAVHYNWHEVYYLWIILDLILSILIWRFIAGHDETPLPRTIHQITFSALLSDKAVIAFLITFIAHSVCAFSALTMNPLYLVEIHELDVTVTATIYGATRLVGFIGSFLGGYLSDRMSKLQLLLLSLTITAVSIYLFAVLPFSPLLIVIMGIQAISINVFFPIIYAVIFQLTSPTIRGKAQGLYNSVAFTIGGLAPFIMGIITDESSFTLAFMFPPLVAGIGIFWLLFLMKKGYSERLAPISFNNASQAD
jgi:predicted MFS family arabinose efflux permease